jgi:hypothetical protein
MLQKLRTGIGFRAAMMIAVLAAFCFMAPPAVLAFGHGSHLMHCLTHSDAVNHGMPSGVGHKDHGDGAKLPANHGTNCCGLFLLSALAPTSGPVVEGLLAPEELSPPVEASFFGQTPDLPHRPPIAPLEV